MSINETKMVRVATMKADGKRYLLDSFHGTKALLWGELTAFKGLRSEHRGGLSWVSETLFTFKEEKKTVALMMALLKQAASADPALAVRIVANGAALACLNEAGDEVAPRVAAKKAGAAAVSDVAERVGFSKADKRTLMSYFLRVT